MALNDSQRQAILIGGTLSFILGLLLSLGLGFGAIAVWVILPDETFASTTEGQWKDLNARMVPFHSMTELYKAETTLQHKSRVPEDINNPIPHYLLGHLYQAKDEFISAKTAYQSALAKAELDEFSKIKYQRFIDPAHAELALMYYLTRQPAASLQEVRKIADIDALEQSDLVNALQNRLTESDRAEFHFILGVELQHLFRFEAAQKEFQEALSLSIDPTFKQRVKDHITYLFTNHPSGLTPEIRYYLNAGDHYLYEDYDLNTALTFYLKASQAHPNLEIIHDKLSVNYQELEQYDLAQQSAHKALALHPDFINVYITLGHLQMDQAEGTEEQLIQEHHYVQAMHYYNKALDKVRHLGRSKDVELTGNLLNNLAYAYEMVADYTMAAQYYEQTLSVTPDYSEEHGYAMESLDRIQSLHTAQQAQQKLPVKS
ncbi:MAG: hypothetical protein KTR14_04885 [Vampirovibrio sp.]|nr:hypothetical protein [Vampirovibrio sp.]